MSAPGYYVHIVDFASWLSRAQKGLVIKNKVRKELWAELVDIVHWTPVEASERADFIRIPSSSFISMQTFCLTDGKGADTVSNDSLLNFCTTLGDLRERLTEILLVNHKTVGLVTVHRDSLEEKHSPTTAPEPKTVVSSVGTVEEMEEE